MCGCSSQVGLPCFCPDIHTHAGSEAFCSDFPCETWKEKYRCFRGVGWGDPVHLGREAPSGDPLTTAIWGNHKAFQTSMFGQMRFQRNSLEESHHPWLGADPLSSMRVVPVLSHVSQVLFPVSPVFLPVLRSSFSAL